MGLEVIPAGIPGPWYRAILTGFSVSSVIAFFTLFSLVWNVALRHNQVWQCDSIATLKFNDVSANFLSRDTITLPNLLWRNATFQTKQKVSSQVINGILTVCESARRKYKASFDRHYQPRALVFLRTESQTVSIPLILTGFSVSSVIAFFTLFSLVWNVALLHNQVWQCDSIATLKFNDVSANFWVAILLHCQTLLWRNATFQTRQKGFKPGNKRDTDCLWTARRKYKSLGNAPGLASFDGTINLGLCISPYRITTVSIPLILWITLCFLRWAFVHVTILYVCSSSNVSCRFYGNPSTFWYQLQFSRRSGTVISWRRTL